MGQLLNVPPKYTTDAIVPQRQSGSHFKTTERIVALGASTGGTEAIKEVLMYLPAGAPGMVITQHIPEAFSGPFARRMDSISAMTVCEAQDGQHILPGHVYIAPGNRHLLVVRDGARYVCRLHNGSPVNRHRPSVDVLFRSVAQHVGPNAVGVLLTGMGDDGARGLKEMHETGAYTLAQDEKTSVVWGMPGQAVKLGGVDKVLPLGEVGDERGRGVLLHAVDEHHGAGHVGGDQDRSRPDLRHQDLEEDPQWAGAVDLGRLIHGQRDGRERGLRWGRGCFRLPGRRRSSRPLLARALPGVGHASHVPSAPPTP